MALRVRVYHPFDNWPTALFRRCFGDSETVRQYLTIEIDIDTMCKFGDKLIILSRILQ